MHRCRSSSAVLFLAAAFASSAFGEAFAASTLEAGDSWIYRQDVISGGKQQGPFRPEYSIPYKNRDGNWIVTVRAAGAPRPASGVAEISQTLGVVDGHGCVIDIPGTLTLQIQPCSVPIEQGDRWSIDTMAGTRRREMRAVAIESVSVPAGTFQAIRIEGEERQTGDGTVTARMVFWYSADIRAMVRVERDFISPSGQPSMHEVDVLESLSHSTR